MMSKYQDIIKGERVKKNLFRTFVRFGIAKYTALDELYEALNRAHLEQAAAMAAAMYGQSPTQLIVDPSIFSGLLGQLGKQ